MVHPSCSELMLSVEILRYLCAKKGTSSQTVFVQRSFENWDNPFVLHLRVGLSSGFLVKNNMLQIYE